jgi:hypothetical protein
MKQLAWRAQVLFIALFAFLPAKAATPEYSIQAIRCANSPGDSVADLVMGAPKDEKIDTVYVIWLIRGEYFIGQRIPSPKVVQVWNDRLSPAG